MTGMLANYRSYQNDHYLKYAIKNHGGEITIEHGFGLEAVHIYAMEMYGHDSHKLQFDLFHFMFDLFGFAAILYLILSLGAFLVKKEGD